MTIQEWGSIGALVAAIATVVTLVYLAVQIRANTAALKIEARRSEFQGTTPYITSIVENPDVARIFREGLVDPQTLSADDFVRFSFLLGQYVGAEAGIYDEVRLGFAPREGLQRRKRTLASFLATPGGRRFWKQFAGNYPDDFRSYVEEEVLGTEGGA